MPINFLVLKKFALLFKKRLNYEKIFIISDLGTNVGLGHYSRSLVLTKEIKHHLKIKQKYLIIIFIGKLSKFRI